MKEKKMVLTVILGVSLVALITTLVSTFIEGLSLLTDLQNIYDLGYNKKLMNTLGGMEIGAVALGIAFVAVFLFNRKKRSLVNLILTILVVLYFVATTIAAKAVLPRYKDYILSATHYSYFVTYLSAMIAITIPAVLVFVSSLILEKNKSEEVK